MRSPPSARPDDVLSNAPDPPPGPETGLVTGPGGSSPAAACEIAACEIQWQNPNGYPEAGARRHRAWITPLVADLVGAAGSLVVRLVGDRAMRRLNATYRGRNMSTDVLSFPGDSGQPEPHLGDIVISVPAARRQAAELGHGVEEELRILVLHGLLHCLGHEHETDDGTMERLENELRRRWIEGAW